MSHHFQNGDTEYFAVGSAYNVLMASKTPCTLPGGIDMEPLDLLSMDDVEEELARKALRRGDPVVAEDVPAEWPAFDRLCSEPVLALHALYFLCHREHDDAERIAFIRSIDDRSFRPAVKALFGALADFFDSRRRPLTASAFRTSIEAAERLAGEAREALAKAITPEIIVDALKQQAGAGSSNSSEPSESPPETPGSGKPGASRSSSGTRRGAKRSN